MSDFGLFLFDVGSDILNGITFIEEGDPIWGWTVIGVIFLPITVGYATIAIWLFCFYSHWYQKLSVLLLAPLLAPIAIPLMTIGYIVFVGFVFARKFVQPGYTAPDGNNGQMAGFFKLLEGVLEANIQAILGLLSPQVLC